MKANTDKNKAIFEYIFNWLDTDIDKVNYNDNKEVQDAISQNASDFKEKIEIALDDETTIEEIRNGEI
jgi:hypothetical protein